MIKTIHTYGCALALGALALAALGCTESHQRDVSTETGNPPIIDSSKIALVVSRDDVFVRGSAGAVTPPQGEVEVKILRTQAQVTGPVEGDGSFDVRVDASLDDVFEVRAVNGGKRSTVVIVVRGGATVGDGDGGVGELICEARRSLAIMQVADAVGHADKSCERSEDCQPYVPQTGCYGGCFEGYFSEAGLAELEQAEESINQGVCASYSSDGCGFSLPGCVAPPSAMCVSGQCVVEGTASCGACLDGTVSWRITSAGSLPAIPDPTRYALSGCNTLSRTTQDGETCSTAVTRCGGDSGAATIEALRGALAVPEVMAAFDAGGSHGSQDFGLAGFFYEISLGDATMTYRSCVSASNCAAPELEALRAVLDAIAQQHACTPTAGDAACTAPFEVGDCDAAISVYWHDPATGTCEPRQYGGCGGNTNRYESLAACEATCGSDGACPPNRVPNEACLECGPAGGCARTDEYCALLCTRNTDCEGEQGPLGFGTRCDDALGICVSLGGCL